MKSLLDQCIQLRYILISLFIMMLSPSSAFGETSLWKISKDNHVLFLGGTLHVLKKEDYPLPDEFMAAFKKADKLVVETNIDATQTPAFGKKMRELLSYGANETLQQALDDKTFAALSTYFSERGLSIESFMKFKPVMVVLTVSMLELSRIGMTGIGVDEFFYRKAQAQNKSIEYSETVDQQLRFIVGMGGGDDNKLVQQTLAEVSKMEAIIQTMKSAWLSGNESKLADAAIADMIRDYPNLYQNLLVKRNKDWMPVIEKMLKDNEVELVLVGALHLVGNEGLLQKLREKGYQVKHFK